MVEIKQVIKDVYQLWTDFRALSSSLKKIVNKAGERTKRGRGPNLRVFVVKTIRVLVYRINLFDIIGIIWYHRGVEKSSYSKIVVIITLKYLELNKERNY